MDKGNQCAEAEYAYSCLQQIDLSNQDGGIMPNGPNWGRSTPSE